MCCQMLMLGFKVSFDSCYTLSYSCSTLFLHANCAYVRGLYRSLLAQLASFFWASFETAFQLKCNSLKYAEHNIFTSTSYSQKIY